MLVAWCCGRSIEENLNAKIWECQTPIIILYPASIYGGNRYQFKKSKCQIQILEYLQKFSAWIIYDHNSGLSCTSHSRPLMD